MSSLIKNVQLQKILSHTLDSVCCMIDGNFIAEMGSDETASLPSSNSDHCNSLKWLDVICNRHYVMAFLDVVKDKCSKLKELRVSVMIARVDNPNMPHVFDTDGILDHVLAAQGKFQEIVEKCHPLTSRLKIFSIVPMLYNSNDEFSCDWIERAKTIDWFKDATHEELVEQVGNRQFNVCQLSSTFYDGFLELDHKTMVFHLSPE